MARAAAGSLLRAEPAAAQAPAPGGGGDEDLPHIRITDPGRDLFRLALPNAQGDAELARQALEVLNRDLDIAGLFRLLDPASFPAQLQAEGLSFPAALWSHGGAQAVAKMTATHAGGGRE